MSYQKARTALADILITAGYNPQKVFKIVQYPQFLAFQLNAPQTFPLSLREFETQESNFTPFSSILRISQPEKYTKFGGVVRLRSSAYRPAPDFDGSTAWTSAPAIISCKFKILYPRPQIIDATAKFGISLTGFGLGINGVQTSHTLPPPGWPIPKYAQK